MNLRPTVGLSPEGGLLLFLPSTSGDGHSIKLPAGETGYALLLRILQARQQQALAPLGSEARPTQYLVDEWLRHHKPTKPSPLPGWADELEITI